MAADAALEVIVQPEPVVAVAAADAEEARLAEHHVVVDAGVGEGFEADPVGGRGAGGELRCLRRRWAGGREKVLGRGRADRGAHGGAAYGVRGVC